MIYFSISCSFFIGHSFPSSYHSLRKGATPPSAVQPIAQSRHRETKQKPQKGKGQTDLPHHISRQAGIILHTPAQTPVNQASGQKFHSSDHGASGHGFFPPAAPCHLSAQTIEQGKAQSSRRGHRPMSASSPPYFHQTIPYAAHQKQPSMLSQSFHIRPPFFLVSPGKGQTQMEDFPGAFPKFTIYSPSFPGNMPGNML